MLEEKSTENSEIYRYKVAIEVVLIKMSWRPPIRRKELYVES